MEDFPTPFVGFVKDGDHWKCNTFTDPGLFFEETAGKSVDAFAVYRRVGRDAVDAEPPIDSLTRLRIGNMIFRSRKPQQDTRQALLQGQSPYAAVLCCADSRVDPAVLFAGSLGELFVVRNAGNVVEPIAIGSLEYAVEHLKVPMVCILGHTRCGAVTATVEAQRGGHGHGKSESHSNIDGIMDRIRPAVASLGQTDGRPVSEVVDVCVRRNAVLQARQLLASSPIIMEELTRNREFRVTVGVYRMEMGDVEWVVELTGANVDAFRKDTAFQG